MAQDYAGKDPLTVAKEAERDLNSHQAKHGHKGSDSTLESGVDEAGAERFPGGKVTYGSAASGAGDNRTIPLGEGGEVDPVTGKMTKARDFEGLGGPVDKARKYAEEHGGADDVRGNIRYATMPSRAGGGGHVLDVTARGIGKGTDVQ